MTNQEWIATQVAGTVVMVLSILGFCALVGLVLKACGVA